MTACALFVMLYRPNHLLTSAKDSHKLMRTGIAILKFLGMIDRRIFEAHVLDTIVSFKPVSRYIRSFLYIFANDGLQIIPPTSFCCNDNHPRLSIYSAGLIRIVQQLFATVLLWTKQLHTSIDQRNLRPVPRGSFNVSLGWWGQEVISLYRPFWRAYLKADS